MKIRIEIEKLSNGMRMRVSSYHCKLARLQHIYKPLAFNAEDYIGYTYSGFYEDFTNDLQVNMASHVAEIANKAIVEFDNLEVVFR